MSFRTTLARRSPAEWVLRIALAIGMLVLGYYCVILSIAQVVVDTDPALASKLAPTDGRITAIFSAKLSDVNATPADRVRADALAEAAWRQDPTAVRAAATLGIDAATRGHIAAATRYFAYAQMLSRRELRTQLWTIEAAVQRGDVPGALRHYDITLRVFPELGDTLYPVLASADQTRDIRNGLIQVLIRKPLWGDNFINFTATNGDPRSTALLFAGLRKAGMPVPETALTSVISKLIAAGQIDAAWAFYASIRPGVDRKRSRDPRFASEFEAPSAFDWVSIGNGGVRAKIQDGIFDFAMPASVGGPLLQQVQVLPPGKYRLTGHSSDIDQVETAHPYWLLKCGDDRELGRIAVPNSADAKGEFSGIFVVPSECPWQTLVMVGQPSDAISGLLGQFDRIQLETAQ